MRKSSLILLLIMLMPSMVFADNVVLTGSQGQIATYNITINKTSSDIGINTFALLNNNNVSIDSSYQKCTTTTLITCQAVFIIQRGSWGTIRIFDNGNLYENITLQNPISYISALPSQPKTYIQVGVSYLPFAVIIIFGSVAIGNIIYYYKKKSEID